MSSTRTLSQCDLETFSRGLPDSYGDHLMQADMLLTLIADREGMSRDTVKTARFLLTNPELSREVVPCCLECGCPSVHNLARCRECCCELRLATGESLEEIMSFGVEPLTLIDRRVCDAVHNRDYCLGCYKQGYTTSSLLCQACVDLGDRVLTTGVNALCSYREVAGRTWYIDYCSVHAKKRELTGLVAYAKSPAYKLSLLHLEDVVRSPSQGITLPPPTNAEHSEEVTLVSNNGEAPDNLNTASLLYWDFFNNLVTNKHLWSHSTDKVIELQLPEDSYRAWLELLKAMRGDRGKLVGYTTVSAAVDFFGAADDEWLLYVHADHAEFSERKRHYHRVGEIVRQGRRPVYAARILRSVRDHDLDDTQQLTFPMMHGNFSLCYDDVYSLSVRDKSEYMAETPLHSIATGMLHSAYVMTQSSEWRSTRASRVEVCPSAINWDDFSELLDHCTPAYVRGALHKKSCDKYVWVAPKAVAQAYLLLLRRECEYMLTLSDPRDALVVLEGLRLSHMTDYGELDYGEFPPRCRVYEPDPLVAQLVHNRHSCDKSDAVVVPVDMILSEVHRYAFATHGTTLEGWAGGLGLDSLYYCATMLAYYAWLLKSDKRAVTCAWMIKSDDRAIAYAEAAQAFLVARDYDALPDEQRGVVSLCR